MLVQHMKCPAVQAAEAEVVKMKELIRVRGCNEEFIADPALLQEGKVQLCPALPLSSLPGPASSRHCFRTRSLSTSVQRSAAISCRWTSCQQQRCQQRTWRGSGKWRKSWQSGRAGWTLSVTVNLRRCSLFQCQHFPSRMHPTPAFDIAIWKHIHLSKLGTLALVLTDMEGRAQ